SLLRRLPLLLSLPLLVLPAYGWADGVDPGAAVGALAVAGELDGCRGTRPDEDALPRQHRLAIDRGPELATGADHHLALDAEGGGEVLGDCGCGDQGDRGKVE